MDDIFSEIDYRSKSDSIVMRLVRSAMDKAHEKVQSKDGPIQFLHERSKFYELAAILVEGGLNIVREETDVIDENREKILSDLMEIRHWLRGRIKDMKHLIIDKDKELKERLENEKKLRLALELKERELDGLRGRKNNESLHDSPVSTEGIEDLATEGDICELKNSLDQQVLNIKQKLEDEQKSKKNDTKKITSHLSSPDFCSQFVDEEVHGNLGFRGKEFCWDDKFSRIVRAPGDSEQKTLIRRMSSDLDDLKRTLDLAFGTILGAEVLPLEKQWRSTVEKDVEKILLKGFINEMRALCSDQNSHERLKEIRKLKTQLDDLSLQILLIEDINQLLFQGLVEDVITNHDEHYLESTIREDVCLVFIQETVMEWKKTVEQFGIFEINDESPRSFMSHDPTMTEDVFAAFIREMSEAWKLERDSYALENLIREDIYHFVFVEAVKDLGIPLKPFPQLNFSDDTPRSRKTDVSERFIEKLDCLSKCLEAEEHLVLTASSEIKAHSVKNDLVILDCEETDERTAIEWLLTDDESTFDSVGRKLEGALQKLHTSKELVMELGLSLDDFEECDHDMQLNNMINIEYENQLSILEKGKNEFTGMIPSDIVLSAIVPLQDLLVDFEITVNKNLDMKCQRLEALTHQVDMLIQPVTSIRNRKLLYKKAFISRCHNLQLAESEVDLLGNQVDALLLLLEKIYSVLNQNATILSPEFEVLDVLKLIKRVLTIEASGKPKS